MPPGQLDILDYQELDSQALDCLVLQEPREQLELELLDQHKVDQGMELHPTHLLPMGRNENDL